MKTSPTQRSLAKLKKDGWLCQITERWNPFAHIRQDLYGFIDIIAVKENRTLAIQTTSGSNVAARITKIKELLQYSTVKIAGWEVEVWGWSKKGKVGKRKLWDCRIIKL